MPSLRSPGFEFEVALRYLLAKRKQAMISVITAISVLGVASGVMAMVIALAINTGLRNSLQRNLLSATPHVAVLEKEPGPGIANWRPLVEAMAKEPGVIEAAPGLYGVMMFSGPVRATGGTVKGILPPEEAPPPLPLQHLKAGEFKDWNEIRGYPPIILGAKLAVTLGMRVGDVMTVINPQGEMTPTGIRLIDHQFRVSGIFESGFFDIDNTWAFASLKDVQRVLAVEDVVSSIELQVADVYDAPAVATEVEKNVDKLWPGLGVNHWMEQNRQLLSALQMERIVTVITIGLIQFVAALNILTSLIMMVMEKHRDIAILLSMGARRTQIRRIFWLQGLIIGVAGTVLGLIAGYAISYFAHNGQWIPLDESLYSQAFVPFEPRWSDGLWISLVALGVSWLATLYPSRSATRIAPAEALRYE